MIEQTQIKIDTDKFDGCGQFYFQQKRIHQIIAKAQEDFFLKLFTELLGRPPDMEKDKGRFQLGEYLHLQKTTIIFDGVEVGEIKKDYINLKWEFIPLNPK